MTKESSSSLSQKQARLSQYLTQFANLGIAFSGGVDSTLLLAVAGEVLGDRVTAFTGRSIIHPTGELELAVSLAQQLGVRHIIFDTPEMNNEQFRRNSRDRCYHCKRGLLIEMGKLAEEEGITALAHGANMDDTADYRPGGRAAEEFGIVAPLVEAGFAKKDIRQLAHLMALPNWNRPAMACLASRIPYGTRIEKTILARIDQAERFLLEQVGVSNCRVRHHGDLVRIEVPEKDFEIMMADKVRKSINERLRDLGYTYVSMDMEGYISGKLNRDLELDQRGRSSSKD